MSKVKVTLQCLDTATEHAAARKMHKHTLSLSHLPRPGDFIKDSDNHSGYAEVAKIIYDLSGNITVAIK